MTLNRDQSDSDLFTIKHFIYDEDKQIIKKPFLGRFDLSKSLKLHNPAYDRVKSKLDD